MIPYRVREDGSVALFWDDIMTATWTPKPRTDDVASVLLNATQAGILIAHAVDEDEIEAVVWRLPWRIWRADD